MCEDGVGLGVCEEGVGDAYEDDEFECALEDCFDYCGGFWRVFILLWR